MKERENILFFLCGWIFLLAFLCKKYCSVEMWKQVLAIDPMCGEIDGSFAWNLRIILLWKHISVVLHYIMTDMQSCRHDLLELPSLSSWYLEWRSAEEVPKLHFPFPYANMSKFQQIRSNFWSCSAMGVYPPSVWKSKSKSQKKAGTEVSLSEGFMPKSPACSVGLPAFSNNNVSH